jgi:hypothetical protein
MVAASTATNWLAFHAITLACLVGVLQSYVDEIPDGHRWGPPEGQVRTGLTAGGKWIRTSGSAMRSHRQRPWSSRLIRR